MSVAMADHIGPWTVDQVLALPEDRRTRYELLGETLLMTPAPGIRHQRASFRLHLALDAAVQAAGAAVEVLEAVNVITVDGLFVPDVVVADAGATAEDTASISADAVQLVVELVSPGNAQVDRTLKPLAYAHAGIPYFWRLEFVPAPRLIMMRLDQGRYIEQATALPGTTTTVNEPFPFSIDPAGIAQQ
ncbi:Uma2 family endonuclease [Streptomyces sp. NBC_01017]|uniref:Uma2 family endonuclease n=1 Tax=Streptomyces sp. NBC_01017 TaxID=2903721 RepID=UPI00386AA93A|nr:Uma2 family endonuclease [Streptomyces sp. NBC_01017]WSV35373.1 Uma2 family endonuclease [Streptomyces sp. NBC_01017]